MIATRCSICSSPPGCSASERRRGQSERRGRSISTDLSNASRAIPRSWIARPVESKSVVSVSSRRPSASPASTAPDRRHVLTGDAAGGNRRRQLPAVARLLPVVTEETCARELLDGHLRLAGAVGAHQRDVLARPQRAGAVEHLRPGGDRDHGVAGECLRERPGDPCAELLRDGGPSDHVDVPEERRDTARGEHARRLGPVDATADDGDGGGLAGERLEGEDPGGGGAERGHGGRVEHRLERPRVRVREQDEPGHGREAARRVARERGHPLEQGVAAAERRHRAEVAGRVVRDVDLRRHRPLAAVVGDEGVADGVVGIQGRDGREDRLAREDGDHRSSRSLLGGRTAPRARRRTAPRRSPG